MVVVVGRRVVVVVDNLSGFFERKQRHSSRENLYDVYLKAIM
jgi:hypothetical protein